MPGTACQSQIERDYPEGLWLARLPRACPMELQTFILRLSSLNFRNNHGTRPNNLGSLIVTTCLVVLSSRFYFWKNRLRRRTPRRTVMGTTDRHGHDGLSQGLVSKHLENLKLGTENRLSELRNGMAGWTVTGVTDRHRLFKELSL